MLVILQNRNRSVCIAPWIERIFRDSSAHAHHDHKDISFQPFSSTRATVCSLSPAYITPTSHSYSVSERQIYSYKTALYLLWHAQWFLATARTKWVRARSWGILRSRSAYLALQSSVPFKCCFSIWVSRSELSTIHIQISGSSRCFPEDIYGPMWTAEVIFNFWERHPGIEFTAVLSYTQMKERNLKAVGKKICFLLQDTWVQLLLLTLWFFPKLLLFSLWKLWASAGTCSC